MSAPRCGACGKLFVDHLGITGTCAAGRRSQIRVRLLEQGIRRARAATDLCEAHRVLDTIPDLPMAAPVTSPGIDPEWTIHVCHRTAEAIQINPPLPLGLETWVHLKGDSPLIWYQFMPENSVPGNVGMHQVDMYATKGKT